MPFIVTCDVEDWLQAYTQKGFITRRCVDNVKKTLDFFDRLSIKSTFFVQGMVAEQYPEVVKQIFNRGHDVQTHGFTHRPLHKLSPQAFREDLARSKITIEQICGCKVSGFRAPAFSIDGVTKWALDILVELGFEFDSSIFPMKLRRYGTNRLQLKPHLIQCRNGAIAEFPITIGRIGPFRIPVGGGGYIRFLPRSILRHFWEKANEHVAVIYLHPYEFSPHDFKGWEKEVSLFLRIQQTYGRPGIENKMDRLLSGKTCRTMISFLEQIRNEAFYNRK
jgi:polysaccharide deacetylase family protein (PEP-CTERM system associated)